MAFYNHPSELYYNELRPGDKVIIGSITATVTSTFIDLGGEGRDGIGKHQESCKLFDVHNIARLIYSDQSDMSGDFPQYTNMRDATKIAQELMRRHYIPQSLRRDIHMQPMSASDVSSTVRTMRDVTSSNFFPGELVSMKSSEEMRELLMSKKPLCGWNDNMFELCGKQFRITSVREHGQGQIIMGLNTPWSISSDMIKHIDEFRPVGAHSSDLPMFATEAVPVYADRASYGAPTLATEAAVRAMRDGTSVSYSEKMMTEPESEKKKSRIVFPKIR